MWTILVVTMILYAVDALVVLGFITINGWRIHWVSRNRIQIDVSQAENDEEMERKDMAIQLAL